MKIKKVTDDWIELDSDGTIWISPINIDKYYFIGKTQSKRIKLSRIDECFEKNKLEKGKYNYYYVEAGDQSKKLLDSDKVFSKIYAKNFENQKSFFKPKHGTFMTYFPQHRNYKYKFSIIMAIYNVEVYIEEAILSVLSQTEKSVQLILVNDGTTDSSGEIAQKFANKYDNIIYLEQENKGVSAARNLGMTVAEGEFWNFMDPDDTISSNTLQVVYDFFKPRKHITDVVAIPLYFFGDKTGQHPLNGKFQKGNRILNLLSAGQSDIDLSLSTSFIQKEAFGDKKLDTSLKVSEDLLLINIILLDKLTLGVVNSARYNYRRINDFGAISKTQTIMNFEETRQRFLVYQRIINESIKRYGTVVKYIQQVVIYDLSWQLKAEKFVNDSVLNLSEKQILRDEYIYKLFEKYIDLNLISESTRLGYYMKQILLHKRASNLNMPEVKNRFGVWQAGYKIMAFEDIKPIFIVANKKNNKLSLYFRINYSKLFEKYCPKFEFILNIGTKRLSSTKEQDNNMNSSKVLYDNIVKSELIKYDIPLDDESYINKPIKLILNMDDVQTEIKVRFTKHEFSSLSDDISIDSISENFVTKLVRGHLYICHKDYHEKEKLLSSAFGKNDELKYQYLLRKMNKKKPVWLFEDRPTMAGDNAEALFQYVNKKHPEIDAYFVIDKSSIDWSRLSKIGNVVDKFSTDHMNIWAIADVVVSAHAEYQIFNPVARGENQNWHNYYKTLRILNKPLYVFLQHGISRSSHHLNRWLNLINKNIRLFVTSSVYELNEFKSESYHYDDDVVQLLGMPRLDSLIQSKDVSQNKVLFMPTWRKKLNFMSESEFLNSEYYTQVNAFLNDMRLLKALKKYDYDVYFRIHPNLLRFAKLFNLPNRVHMTVESYHNLFLESKIAVTDFSSAVLDFAYMKRPIIQYKFDQSNYYNGHIFNYEPGEKEQAIYGNIYSSEDYDLFMSELINKMKNPVMESRYKEKVDRDFPLRDGQNCERVFLSVQNLINSVED